MNIDELTIGQAKEVAAQIAPLMRQTSSPKQEYEHGLKIVVLDKGFVYIGIVYTDGEWVVIQKAHNIRRWGTTNGLGQLAKHGPTADTRLDRVGTVKAPFHVLQQLIDVEVNAWENKL